MAKEPFVARLTSIWLGAFFFWLLHGCKGSYNGMIADKHNTRNLWTGYIITLLAAILLFYFTFIK